ALQGRQGRHGDRLQPARRSARRRAQGTLRRRRDASECGSAGDTRGRGLPDGVQEEGQPAGRESLSRPLLPAREHHSLDHSGRLPARHQIRDAADEREPQAEALPRSASERQAGADHRPGLGPRQARRAAEHRPGRAARRQSEAGARAASATRRGARERPIPSRGRPLLRLGPSLARLAGVVLYPAIELVRASFGRYSITGLYQGSAGAQNYVRLFAEPALPGVVLNTAVWVAVIVAVTVMLSLGVAQFLDRRFPGRRLVRWALIVPWAASLIMTSKLFVWVYDYYFGMLNRLLEQLHVLTQPVDWLGEESTIMAAMIAVGIYVSLPFTTYVLLAGHQAIPNEVYEAARVDGASGWRTYRSVTLPLLRPALLVAVVLNTVYVF